MLRNGYLLPLLLALAGALLAGCTPAEEDQGDTLCPDMVEANSIQLWGICRAPDECAAGTTCRLNVCVPECADAADCEGDGAECVSNGCAVTCNQYPEEALSYAWCVGDGAQPLQGDLCAACGLTCQESG